MLETPFECLGVVYNILGKCGAAAGAEESYLPAGSVQLKLIVDADKVQQLQKAIADATSGKVQAFLATPAAQV